MNSQSPIYSLKFTITWIFVYGIIVFVLWQFLQIFIAIYLGLWVLNLLIEIVERLFLRFGKRIITCLLYTSPSPRDLSTSRMPSSA